MKAIVPIISGQDSLPEDIVLRNRVEYLLKQRGFDSEWISEGTITPFLKTDLSKVYVPMIIALRTNFNEKRSHDDLILPVCNTFRTALLISENLIRLPERIFRLPQEISLWEKRSPVPDIICAAIRYIYTHLSEADLSISVIAREVYTSKNTLERKFKEWNGSGIWHFVRHVRLLQAKRILQESNEQVNGVASSVGYEDYRSFTKAFKDAFHMSPLEFRHRSRRVDTFLFKNDAKWFDLPNLSRLIHYPSVHSMNVFPFRE